MDEFCRLNDNDLKMAQDIMELTKSLNSLHEVMTRRETKELYSSILLLFLSFVTLIGGNLFSVTNAAAEIGMEIEWDSLLSLGTVLTKSFVQKLF